MKTRKRTLVLCDDPWHPAATVRRGLAALGDGSFDFHFLDGGSKWSAAVMQRYPLVLLAKANTSSSAVMEPWLTPESEWEFPNYVSRGNGLVVVHAGIVRYERLPATIALMGGAFQHHPEPCEVTISPDARHPAAAGVSQFTLNDEQYFVAMNDSRSEVFLHTHSKHGVQPAGWTRVEGEGRVCVLTPGHSGEVWLHPAFQKLLLNALNWASKTI